MNQTVTLKPVQIGFMEMGVGMIGLVDQSTSLQFVRDPQIRMNLLKHSWYCGSQYYP